MNPARLTYAIRSQDWGMNFMEGCGMPDILKAEKETVTVMITLHCTAEHGFPGGACPKCTNLLDYALERLEKCPIGQAKPTCAKCAIHCYAPDMRTAIRTAMRYSGPRMIFRHPVMAIAHIIRGIRHAR